MDGRNFSQKLSNSFLTCTKSGPLNKNEESTDVRSKLAYVAVTKSHQRLIKIFVFSLNYIREISKVYKKIPAKLDAILCDHHELNVGRVSFYSIYTWQNFLVNNFADFPDVQVKKSRFCQVVGGVSLQQHLLLDGFCQGSELQYVTHHINRYLNTGKVYVEIWAKQCCKR